ncbi:MAG: ABC transporter ATP-binding protein [Myxococcota bacterium]
MTDSQLLRKLYRLAVRPYRKMLLCAVLLYGPVTLLALAQPLVIGAAVDRGMQPGDPAAVTRWAGVYLGAVLLYAVVEMLQLQLMQLVGQRVLRDLRHTLFAKAQRLPMPFFARTPLGHVLSRIGSDTEALGEIFSSGAVAVLGDLLFVASTLVMLLLVDVRLSWSVLALMPLLIAGMWCFRVWTQKAYHHVRASMAELSGHLQEHLAGMATVQMFGQAQRASRQAADHSRAYMQANRQAVLLDAAVYSFVDACGAVATAAVLWAAYGQKQIGALQLGVLVAFVEALGRFFHPLRELSNRYTVFQSAVVCTRRILAFLRLEEEEPPRLNTPPARFRREIGFNAVRFAYAQGADDVLKGVSFTVQRGESIALVGRTGAGKTTITKLLQRLYDVTGGHITIDGVDIRRFSLPDLRKLFNVVPQEVTLMSGTLRDNLCYGRSRAADDEVWAALRTCQADYLVGRAGGLDAKVDPRGGNFSLGERQLLALCRALIADPAVLILDEATASIDPYTERRLQTATARLLASRTCFIVAHRLETIHHCDRILVFHNGQLIEQGNHGQLMRDDGMYAKLARLQLQQSAPSSGV